MNVDVEVDVIVAPKLLPANPSNCANHFWQFSVPFLLAQKLKVFCDVIAFAPAVSLIKFKRLTKKKTPSRLPTKRALFNFRVLHSIHAPKLGQHTHTSTHTQAHTHMRSGTLLLGSILPRVWKNPRHAFRRQNMRLWR